MTGTDSSTLFGASRRLRNHVLAFSLLASGGCSPNLVEPSGAEGGKDSGTVTARVPDAAAARTLDAGFVFAPPDADPNPPKPQGCVSAANDDRDQDGYSVAQGDCNDCDLHTNPGAYDVAGNQIDEDCSGAADDEPQDCDDGLPEDGDAAAAAKALGLCRSTVSTAQGKDRTWGVVKASYVFPDGTLASLKAVGDGCKTGAPPNPLSHGVLAAFGKKVKPRQGKSLAALSSGAARSGSTDVGKAGTSPEGASMCTRSRTPTGFPVSSFTTCGDIKSGTSTYANDAIALELVIRVPTNAKALSYDFDFYTYEYSSFVCSSFNDAFVALLFSKSPDVPMNHNISFDSQSNPVSVNNGFVEVCEPFTYEGVKAGKAFSRSFPCVLGTSELDGTGFEEHAASGWLQTMSNVVPGEEITLRFAIWDAGDDVLDSTVLLDNFKWSAEPGTTVTTRPPPIQ